MWGMICKLFLKKVGTKSLLRKALSSNKMKYLYFYNIDNQSYTPSGAGVFLFRVRVKNV
jgi:hypothetical protein